MAKKTGFCASFNKLGLLIKLLVTIFLDPIIGAIYRIAAGRIIAGILWLITGGLFGIGWIIDILTVLLKGKYTLLA